MKSALKKRKQNLSYFYSTLQKHLYEHFPELIQDEEMIHTRVANAEEAYIVFITDGYGVWEAVNESTKELLNGLEFSKFDMLYDIITEEFTHEIPEETQREFSKNMIGFCQDVFDKYPPEESEELRTELIGSIAAYIKGLKLI